MLCAFILEGMTKTLNKGNQNSSENGPFRRWVKQLFANVVRCSHGEIEEVLERLREIQGSIEIIAREMARQSRRWK